jgi:hypothetical protein
MEIGSLSQFLGKYTNKRIHSSKIEGGDYANINSQGI